MTRKDMDADLRVSLDALVNKQVERGARDGRNEAIVTIVALLAACVMAAMLCHCGGAPFTAEQLTIRADDGGNTSTDGGPQGDDASSAVDAMGGGEAASDDAGGDSDPPSVDASAQVDAAVDSGPPIYMHHNGLGQTWTDSTPLGTYSEAEAMNACTAYTSDASQCVATFCGVTGDHNLVGVVGKPVAWAYAGGAAEGHVGTMAGACPSSSDPSWQ